MVLPLIGKVAAAAIPSLISGLFGRSGSQKTTTTTNFRALVRNAEKAGINPITALRAGAGAGFTTVHHPSMSLGNTVANIAGEAVNQLIGHDPHAEETAKLERDLLRANIGLIQERTRQARTLALRGTNVGGHTDRLTPVYNNAGQPQVTEMASGQMTAPGQYTPLPAVNNRSYTTYNYGNKSANTRAETPVELMTQMYGEGADYVFGPGAIGRFAQDHPGVVNDQIEDFTKGVTSFVGEAVERGGKRGNIPTVAPYVYGARAKQWLRKHGPTMSMTMPPLPEWAGPETAEWMLQEFFGVKPSLAR